MADYDLAIIGGGINGVGIARDAAGRGLRVLLLEQNDLASGTSSASTKLIHGGLRYLEHGAFLLVREALAERERLLKLAPHIIRPMRFVLPVTPGAALAAAVAARPLPLRPDRRPRDPAGDRDPRPHASRRRPAAEAALPLGLRIFRLLGRRLPPGRAQRGRRRRARRDDPHPHAAGARRARGRVAADPQRRRPPRGGDCAAFWSTPPDRGSASSPRPCCGCRAGRRCASSRAAMSWCLRCSTTTAATSSRTPTAASCLRCRSRNMTGSVASR